MSDDRETIARKVQRRIFPRAGALVGVSYSHQGQELSCVAVDFGVQGACLLMEMAFPATENEDLAMSFDLGDDWIVPCQVKKIWEKDEAGKFLVGVTYRTERSTDKNLIGPWIHKMQKKAPPSNRRST